MSDEARKYPGLIPYQPNSTIRLSEKPKLLAFASRPLSTGAPSTAGTLLRAKLGSNPSLSTTKSGGSRYSSSAASEFKSRLAAAGRSLSEEALRDKYYEYWENQKVREIDKIEVNVKDDLEVCEEPYTKEGQNKMEKIL